MTVHHLGSQPVSKGRGAEDLMEIKQLGITAVDQKEEKREQWSNSVEFILSCLGYAIGLGNVWRFPYLCGKSGGAAFLIPYFIFMFFAGMPVFYMELVLGQYAAVGPNKLYDWICPVFSGIGYAMFFVAVYTSTFYNMVIAWSIYYMVASFNTVLPWDSCQNSWNTDFYLTVEVCYDERQLTSCNQTSRFCGKHGCISTVQDFEKLKCPQVLKILSNFTLRRTTAAEYFNKRVLMVSDGLHEIGQPNWELVIALLAAWILTFLCLVHGIKSSGKVVYFTATFPFVMIVIFLIRGVLLDGAWKGIRYFIVPRFEELARADVWGNAAFQIFFSLGIGQGGLVTLSSYNRFSNNILRDSLIVALGDCFVSIIAGFAVFGIVGFIATQLGQDVQTIAAEGPGLAFVAYADAVTRFPIAPQLWSFLFFFMLIILGIDSQLVVVEVIATFLADQWPSLRQPATKRMLVAAVCAVLFLFGLVLTAPVRLVLDQQGTAGGQYVLQLLDQFTAGWPLLVICLVEIIMISYIYGLRRFNNDIETMLGFKAPNTFWRLLGYPTNMFWIITWLITAPGLLIFVLIFNWTSFRGTQLGDYAYPAWGEGIGWFCFLSCVIWIPLVAFYKVLTFSFYHKEKSMRHYVRAIYERLLQPKPEWDEHAKWEFLRAKTDLVEKEYAAPAFKIFEPKTINDLNNLPQLNKEPKPGRRKPIQSSFPSAEPLLLASSSRSSSTKGDSLSLRGYSGTIV